MTPISSFTSRIAPLALGASDPLIEQAALDACIDFCEKSLIVKTTLDPISTVAAQADYDLDAPSQQNVCKIINAWCDTVPLTPIAEDAVGSAFGYTDTIPGSTRPLGRPQFFQENAPGTLTLQAAPDAVYQLTVRAACKPKRSATQVEDVLYENWIDAIVSGTLARLYAMVGQSFGNVQLAAARQGMYVAGVNAAQVEATRGRNRAEHRVRPARI